MDYENSSSKLVITIYVVKGSWSFDTVNSARNERSESLPSAIGIYADQTVPYSPSLDTKSKARQVTSDHAISSPNVFQKAATDVTVQVIFGEWRKLKLDDDIFEIV